MGFADEIGDFEKKALGRIRNFRRALAMKVFSRVILRTPVDTGRARGNWQCTMGSPADGVLDAEDKTGAEAIARARDVSVGIGTDDRSIFLTNNLPYIEALENGHSGQAPQGMVAITVAEFEGLAEQVAGQVEGNQNADAES